MVRFVGMAWRSSSDHESPGGAREPVSTATLVTSKDSESHTNIRKNIFAEAELIYNFGTYSYQVGLVVLQTSDHRGIEVAHQLRSEAKLTAPPLREIQPPSPMAKDLQSRFLFVVIALLSVAAVVFAWINFQKDREIVHALRRRVVGRERRPPASTAGGCKRSGREGRRQAGRLSGRRRRPHDHQRRQPGAADLPHRSLVENHLLAGSPGDSD